MKKILIIQGHPNKESFCHSIAKKYEESAAQKGHTVDIVNLVDLNFDPILRFGFQGYQVLEKDLIDIQNRILKASHVVWIYPNWWGGQPALLKGFIDRTLLPGFAFKYKSGIGFPEKLLTGRTSEIIMTLDTPTWVYKYFMGAPGLKAMRSGILEFCGLKVTREKLIGPIRGSKPKSREQWLLEIGKIP